MHMGIGKHQHSIWHTFVTISNVCQKMVQIVVWPLGSPHPCLAGIGFTLVHCHSIITKRTFAKLSLFHSQSSHTSLTRLKPFFLLGIIGV